MSNIIEFEKSIHKAIIEDSVRFRNALSRMDEINSKDPNFWDWNGRKFPRELVFSLFHYNKVIELDPGASEALLLAARGQHICRWESPRSDYPDGRVGYLKWRADLKKFHAKKNAEVLEACGYSASIVDRVQALNLKEAIKTDEECQLLEDALCLVFLEQQFEQLANSHSEEKIISILQKTAKKMSQNGLDAIGQIKFSDHCASLLAKAFA